MYDLCWLLLPLGKRFISFPTVTCALMNILFNQTTKLLFHHFTSLCHSQPSSLYYSSVLNEIRCLYQKSEKSYISIIWCKRTITISHPHIAIIIAVVRVQYRRMSV